MPTFLVTGANRGIGLETAAGLCAANHTVVLAARSSAAAADAARVLTARNLPGRALPAPAPLDLASPASVSSFVKALGGDPPLDGLILNAGAPADAALPAETWPHAADAPIAIVAGHIVLAAALAASQDHNVTRIVFVSSRAHVAGRLGESNGGGTPTLADLAPPTTPFRSYGRSKLCCTLATAACQSRTGVRAVAASPGFVATGLADALLASAPRPVAAVLRWVAKTPADGAVSSVAAATLDDAAIDAASPPAFVHNGRLAPWLVPRAARDSTAADALWSAAVAAAAEAGVEW